MFTLTVLFEALLLFVNGLAILNEERFLAKSKYTYFTWLHDNNNNNTWQLAGDTDQTWKEYQWKIKL